MPQSNCDVDEDKPIELPILKRPPNKKEIYSNKHLLPNSIDKQQDKYDNNRLRDPRFDPRVAGSNDVKHYIRNYSFIDEVRQCELKELQNALRKEKDVEKKTKIKTTITRIRNKMVERQNKAKKMELIDNMKKSLASSSITMPSTSKQPVTCNQGNNTNDNNINTDRRPQNKYRNIKKSDIKKNLLVNKYKELKETGKLNKYLERKRKKLINRDGKGFS